VLLIDSQGRKTVLGDKIAQGGEGAVFKVQSQANLVAKLYHKPPGAERVAKLRSMAQSPPPELLRLACWPVDLLASANGGQIQGFLMPNAAGHKEIHKLYSPKSRQAEFHNVDWRFLIVAASNVARAFAIIHKHGHVIGDVNHSSVMIGPDSTVLLIDCDSFQVRADGRSYPCTVAEPLHTPPELQGKNVSNLTRTPNHDNFGLAVLIFELLFMGRHPYAGGFLGSGDPSLEQKIARYLFAYGSGASARHMRQPPNSLQLEAVSQPVASMFESAFVEAGAKGRPEALEWATALSGLLKSLKPCPIHQSHYYFSGLTACPWCEIEGKVGISLFNLTFAPVDRGTFNLALVWESILKVEPPPDIKPPSHKTLPKLKPGPDYIAAGQKRRLLQICGAAIGITLAIASLLVPSLICVGIGLGGMVWALMAKAGKEAANAAKHQAAAAHQAAHVQLTSLQSQWIATASRTSFQRAVKELERKKFSYQDLPALRQREIAILHTKLRESQLHRYLDGFRIRPGLVTGVGAGRCATLSSYGIETAADVGPAVQNVPGFGDHLTAQLMTWRSALEQQFKFDPNKGLDPRDLQKLDSDLATLKKTLEEDLLAGPSLLKQIAVRTATAQTALAKPIEQAWYATAQAQANLTVL
jgi:DNA-binding helix-hairpin-helix protein with protein kinase domain